MNIIEQIHATYGKRVALDTPLRITTYDTESIKPPSGIGQWTHFEFKSTVQTAIQEDDVEAFHRARREAARFITRELYGDIADRLVEISFREYETNLSGSSEVREMLDKLISELRP